MKNYCCNVTKSGYRSQGEIDTVIGINVYELRY